MEIETVGNVHARGQKGRVRIGYARVSKREGNLALQVKALKAAGCERIFTEKIRATADSRPVLDAVIKSTRMGDQLVVWKLDRFARDLLDQLLKLGELQRRGASLVTLTESVDTSDWMGRIMSRQLGLYSEAELYRITERTRAGVAAALERGVKFGRRPKMTCAQVKEAKLLIRKGIKAAAVAAHFNVGRSTLFRYLQPSSDSRVAIKK